MQIEPPVTAFARRYARGEPQIVWTTLVADLETPVSAFLKIAGQRPMSFLLESVEGGEARGRYSIIGLDPDLVWRTADGRAEILRRSEGRNDFQACEESRFRRCAPSLPRAASRSPIPCPQWLPASSAISATTWSG